MESVTESTFRCALALAVARLAFAGSALAADQAVTLAAAPSPERARQPSVSVTLVDPSPVIGVTGETMLRIDVTNTPPEGTPLPRVLCSAGHVEDLGRDGPSTFSARYILPAGRFPQPAIIVAEFGTGTSPLRGMTTVRLRAATTPSLRTDPGAQVTLRVGDRDFGPQTAPADGVVRIPVVVPPGVETATARSVNAHGKATEQTINLQVPYSQRVLVASPENMQAGSFAEVAVYAVEPSGRPANGSSLVLRAFDGRATPLGSRIPGEALFLVRAPTVLREHRLRLQAQIQGQSTTRLGAIIHLLPGPATGLSLEPESSYVSPQAGSTTRVFLGAEDAFGNPVHAGRADVLVNDTLETVTVGLDGEPFVTVRTPPQGQKRVLVEGVLDHARAERVLPVGVAAKRVPVPRLAPPSSRYTLTPRIGFLWSLGEAEGVAVFIDALAFRLPRLPDLGLGLSLGMLQTWFVAEDASGMGKAQLSTFPVLVRVHYRGSAGRTFVGIGAAAGFAVAFERMHAYGSTVAGHSHAGVAEAMVESGLRLRHGQLVLGARYLYVDLARFSSGDSFTGNAGGMSFDLGYRFGF